MQLPFVATSTTPVSVLDKIVLYANTYNIDLNSFYKTIECESGFDPNVQSQFKDKNGKQEQSYGLAQINVGVHTDVSIKEAKDPDFALTYMAKSFANGLQNRWSCYTILKSKGEI